MGLEMNYQIHKIGQLNPDLNQFIQVYASTLTSFKIYTNLLSSQLYIHSFSSLSYDRSKASSKASSPHSAI